LDITPPKPSAAQQVPETLSIESQVKNRFGVLPNFFRLNANTPDIRANLWGFAKAAYLDNPLPSLFKERLFVHLSRFCDVRYCVARHVGFLVGLGRPSGDSQSPTQTVVDVVRLLQQPFPHGERLADFVSLAQRSGRPLEELPAADSEMERAVFAFAGHVFLQTSDASASLQLLSDLFGEGRLQYLVLFLAFVRTAHYWTKVHPELGFEDDIRDLLFAHEALATCILSEPEALSCGVSQTILDELPLLKAQTRLLAAAQRIAKLGSWRFDLTSDTVIWSEELYRICGRDPNLPAPSYKEHPQLFTTESWERLRRDVEEALHTGTPYELDVEMVHPDGTTRWLHARGEAQRDSVGRIVQLYGTVQDITEQKGAEEVLRDISGRLISAQEEERSRIARELHDDLSQQIALLQIGLEQFEQDETGLSSEASKKAHNLTEIAAQISSNIHDLSHRLHPSKLDVLGLLPSLAGLCREFSEIHHLQVQLAQHGIPEKIPKDVTLCLFRIAQEALRNVVKHSGAAQAKVELLGLGDRIELCVLDTGVGFDPESAKGRQGIGLVSMRERLRLIGGDLTVESASPHGTRIRARAPLPTTHVTSKQEVNKANA
jgi:signal transduction histidine kinase